MTVLAFLAALVLPGVQTIAPRVAAVEPAGGQRGTEVTVTLRGERLRDTLGCLVERPGIEVLAATSAAADRAELRLLLRADCPLGQHALHLRTACGCSNVFLFSVSALPSVAEQREAGAPQTIPFGCCVEGALRGDEVDSYHVAAPPGAAVCCEVEGIRLGQEALDLELVVTGPDGAVLAEVDDAAPTGKDPWCSFTAPAAGPIAIAVRPAVPGEGPRGVYRLHVGSFPRPVGALPCGGRPGAEIEVQLLAGADAPRLRVRLPDDGSERFAWVPEPGGVAAPSAIWLRVGGPEERAPTPDGQGRLWLDLPGSVHGVVADAAAPPRYWFHGVKGEEIEFAAVARALCSPLDPALMVRAADGRFLAYNDDGNTADSVLRFSPPADGDYSIEVRDLLRSASPTHFFRLEAGPRTSAARITQSVPRPSLPLVSVPQGGRGSAVLQLQGIAGNAAVVVEGLPAGVVAEVGPRLPGTNLVPVLFSAAADAALAGAMLPVGVRVGEGAVDHSLFVQVTPLLTGRNDVPLVAAASRHLPLAVTRPAPWQVVVEPPRVPLVRGGAITLPVSVQRSEGYGNRLRVRPVFAPPGVSVGQSVVDANGSAGTLLLEAGADAPIGEFPCLLTTIARVDGAVFEHALPFLMVQVAEPWVRAEIGKARTRQGRACELQIALAMSRAAAAPWPATLTGLPRGVTAAPQQVAVDATSVTFALTVAADAAVGRHRGLQVELRPAGPDGLPVLHRFPAGELRIDAAPAVAAPAVQPPGGGS